MVLQCQKGTISTIEHLIIQYPSNLPNTRRIQENLLSNEGLRISRKDDSISMDKIHYSKLVQLNLKVVRKCPFQQLNT